jgi:hypothetical protein
MNVPFVRMLDIGGEGPDERSPRDDEPESARGNCQITTILSHNYHTYSEQQQQQQQQQQHTGSAFLLCTMRDDDDSLDVAYKNQGARVKTPPIVHINRILVRLVCVAHRSVSTHLSKNITFNTRKTIDHHNNTLIRTTVVVVSGELRRTMCGWCWR